MFKHLTHKTTASSAALAAAFIGTLSIQTPLLALPNLERVDINKPRSGILDKAQQATISGTIHTYDDAIIDCDRLKVEVAEVIQTGPPESASPFSPQAPTKTTVLATGNASGSTVVASTKVGDRARIGNTTCNYSIGFLQPAVKDSAYWRDRTILVSVSGISAVNSFKPNGLLPSQTTLNISTVQPPR